MNPRAKMNYKNFGRKKIKGILIQNNAQSDEKRASTSMTTADQPLEVEHKNINLTKPKTSNTSHSMYGTTTADISRNQYKVSKTAEEVN